MSNLHDKIFRLITQRNLDVIDKVNAALEPVDLVRAVVSILGREDLSVKKKMLDMLNQRIVHKVHSTLTVLIFCQIIIYNISDCLLTV